MRRWRKKRKQIQFYRLIICYIIGITIFMGAEGSVCAEEAQAEPLRVILVNYDGYGYIIQDNNEIGGYFVEYLEKIARYTGWKYDYEVVSDEDRLMAITQQKDYDLMVGVPYDEESKRNYFEYPNKELANRRLLLATTKEHSDLTEDALRTKKTLRWDTQRMYIMKSWLINLKAIALVMELPILKRAMGQKSREFIW